MALYEEIEAQIARIDTALGAALNMIDGDGLPPDWDYLRLVRSQLPRFNEMIGEFASLAAGTALESGPR